MNDTQVPPDTRPDWLSDAPPGVTEGEFTDALMRMVREVSTGGPAEPVESLPGWDSV